MSLIPMKCITREMGVQDNNKFEMGRFTGDCQNKTSSSNAPCAEKAQT